MDKIFEFLKNAFSIRTTWKGRLGQLIWCPLLILALAAVMIAGSGIALVVVVIDTVFAPLTCVVAYVSGWKYTPLVCCIDDVDDKEPGFTRLKTIQTDI